MSTTVSLPIDLTIAPAAPPSFAADVFWPPSDSYRVAFVEVDLDRLPPPLDAHRQEMVTLTALGNALRALQTGDGSFLDRRLARALLDESGGVLMRVAGALEPGPVAGHLRDQARALLSPHPERYRLVQVRPEGSGVVLVCSPLATWDWKSRQRLHTVLVGAVDHGLAGWFDELDGRMGELARLYERALGLGPMRCGHVPEVIPADLVLCGGEADTYPKQFAYFVPDSADLGDGAQEPVEERTICFSNIYHHRFRVISLPLLELASGPAGAAGERALDPAWLLTWFKGHDVGHFWELEGVPASTDFATFPPEMAVLHEMMADLLGYLAVAGPWSPSGTPDAETAGVVVMAEMMRYLRRGIEHFPDSGAALVELAYLLEHGHASLSDDGTLRWTPEGVHAGLTALCREATHAVLATDQEARRALLRRYGPPAAAPLQAALDRLFERAHALPHDIGLRTVAA